MYTTPPMNTFFDDLSISGSLRSQDQTIQSSSQHTMYFNLHNTMTPQQQISNNLKKLANKQYSYNQIIQTLQKFRYISAQNRYYQPKHHPIRLNYQALNYYHQQIPQIYSHITNYILNYIQHHHQDRHIEILTHQVTEINIDKNTTIYLICIMSIFLIPKQEYHNNQSRYFHHFSKYNDFSIVFNQNLSLTKAIIQYIKIQLCPSPILDNIHTGNIHTEPSSDQTQPSIDQRQPSTNHKQPIPCIQADKYMQLCMLANHELTIKFQQKNNEELSGIIFKRHMQPMKKLIIEKQHQISDKHRGYLKIFGEGHSLGPRIFCTIEKHSRILNHPEIMILTLLVEQDIIRFHNIYLIGFKHYPLNPLAPNPPYELDSKNRPKEYIATGYADFISIQASHRFRRTTLQNAILTFYNMCNLNQPQVFQISSSLHRPKNDPRIVLLIQWLASSLSNKNLTFCYNDTNNIFNQTDLFDYLAMKSIGDVYKLLIKAGRQCRKAALNRPPNQIDIFEKIKIVIQNQKDKKIFNIDMISENVQDYQDLPSQSSAQCVLNQIKEVEEERQEQNQVQRRST